MKPLQVGLKRAIDVIGSLMGLIIFSPILVTIALIIKATDGGPPFFRQERIGQFGKPFQIIKFRSMCVDAETVLRSNPELWAEYVRNGFKLPEGSDPRITPIGRWLRKTSLDELPQLWNVLKGEMSLVGPRPLVAEELELWYGERASELVSVKPGMTGLWQVSGRSTIGYPQRAELELSYVRNWSIWGDIVILWRTLYTVVSRKGAY